MKWVYFRGGKLLEPRYDDRRQRKKAMYLRLLFLLEQAFSRSEHVISSLNPASGRVMEEKAGMSYLNCANGVERKEREKGTTLDLIYYLPDK